MARRMTAQGYARLQARREEEDRRLFAPNPDLTEEEAIRQYVAAQEEEANVIAAGGYREW